MDNGEIVTETESILAETTKFYKTLYSTGGVTKQEVDSYLTSIHINKTISDEDTGGCEGDINESECLKAIKKYEAWKIPWG